MEGHCSTGQSSQWAVVPMEEGHYLSQKYFESFEILCRRRMEKINWTDRVQNIAILTPGRKENPTYKRTKATWIGHNTLPKERFNRQGDEEDDVKRQWIALKSG